MPTDSSLEAESDSSSEAAPPSQARCTEDNALGLVNVTEAAGLGSDVAACNLGEAFFEGIWGLPKDPVRARYWLRKVADGGCEYKHLNDAGKADAARWLRELDE